MKEDLMTACAVCLIIIFTLPILIYMYMKVLGF